MIAYDLCTNVIRWIGGEFMHPPTTTKNCGVHIKYVRDWSQDRFNFGTSLFYDERKSQSAPTTPDF